MLGDRYRLVEQLGSGGMSVVWRGYDEVLGRQVAVKMLASRLASDREFRHRIRIEAQAAARLCHPHITNVYDYGESVQVGLTVPYVVMELVDGESLTARLTRSGRLPWREAVTVGAEVASALATAHARGVVHRDVTPGNVMLTATGARVVDFGISALVGESDTTPNGALLGTPAYLAPERLDRGQVSPATDVYALGLLLYRMLTGRLPWRASTGTQMLRAHLYTEPAPMGPVDGLPEEVAHLVHRCLAKQPADRPDSAEVARTLAGAAGLAAVVPVSPAPWSGGDEDPEAMANAGTTILPWSAATDALPLSAARARRVADRRARVQVAAVGVGLLAVTGAVWGVTSRSPASGGVEKPTEARMMVGEPAGCEVRYALRRDTGKTFEAEVRVANTGSRALPAALRFDFPGEQRVAKADRADWHQQDATVLLRPPTGDGGLAPGAAAQLTLAGRYDTTNPLPVRFRIGDTDCAVQVSAVTGAPATTAPATTGAPPTSGGRKATGGPGSSGGSSSGSKKSTTGNKGKGSGDAPGKGTAPDDDDDGGGGEDD
ncbi:serine/threonine-protein kinase [Micromonospora sp. CPCC 206060]